MSDLVITGHCALRPAPGAPLAPDPWVTAPARLGRMDRLSALTLVAADGALGSAALSPPDEAVWDGARTAVVLGSAFGCHATNEDYYRAYLADPRTGASPRLFAYTLPSSPVGEISIHYRITGPLDTLVTGLGAGLDALAEAGRLIERGRVDRAIAVGADVATALLARLLGRPGEPAELCDSASAFIVERAEIAAARGAVPLAHLLATSSMYRRARRTLAVKDACQAVLRDADMPPGAIVRVLGQPDDIDAVRAIGITALVESPGGGCLGARPLVDLSAHLQASGPMPVLVVAGDAEGTGAAALLTD